MVNGQLATSNLLATNPHKKLTQTQLASYALYQYNPCHTQSSYFPTVMILNRSSLSDRGKQVATCSHVTCLRDMCKGSLF